MNRLQFLGMREELMENIDTIVDSHVSNERDYDDLVTKLCDMVCEVMDPAGLD